MKLKPVEWKETETGCWECTSHKVFSEYPMLFRNHERQHVYKFIYEQCFGFRPDGMVIRHSCNNRMCINPEHLMLGTYSDNINDRKVYGNYINGEYNPNHKITWDRAEAIRNEYTYRSGAKLARKYGISKSQIVRIAHGGAWANDGYGVSVIS